ncbi:phospholipase D-like domain-containing protein [Thiovibrio sp. JS02]
MLLIVLGMLWGVVMIYGQIKPLPQGISVAGRRLAASEVEFLHDLTYRRDGGLVSEQRIFARMCRIIAEAERFVLLDVFLFNDLHDPGHSLPTLTATLTETLLAKKKECPGIDIVVITDEINSNYGVSQPEHFRRLEKAGIRIVSTDTARLRDSNFVYSAAWRMVAQWFGGEGPGWLPNPFAATGPRMTLTSYLRLMNFRANHRKVVASEKEAMVTSANPHDASACHSNIALVARGEVVQDIVEAEQAVAAFSGLSLPPWQAEQGQASGPLELQFLTEGKIKARLLEGLGNCGSGCTVRLAMFYLAEREIIRELLAAAERGALVRIILDANSEAFGRAKNGLPNRPVAHELVEKSRGRIALRWYATSGEQFHSKLTMITFPEQSLIIGGSANLTRRNIDDLNLEACLAVLAPNGTAIVREVAAYFDRIWQNEDGDYSRAASEFSDPSPWRYARYRFQEWSGMSTF